MKNYFWLLLIGFVISCNDDKNIDYTIEISGISTSSAAIGDTVDIYIDWGNSDFTEDISIKIQDISITPLSFINNTTIRVIIPSNIDNSNTLYIEHPNGAEAEWCCIKKIDNPRVESISSLEGKGGDEITLTGIDFTSGDSIGVMINTLNCEITNINDTIITFIVPDGCGNGKVRLLIWPEYYSECAPKEYVEIGIFNYLFEELTTESQVYSYYCYYDNYLIERDESGRVAKRIILTDDSTNTESEYETFSYNSNGLVDSVKYYLNGEQEAYSIYARNSDNSILEITKYYDGEFFQKQEFQYLDNKLIQWNQYYSSDSSIYMKFSEQYTYKDDSLIIDWQRFSPDGSADGSNTSKYVLDIYNSGFPDLGAPGFPDFDDGYVAPYITSSSFNCKIKYDKYGRLVSWDKMDSFCSNSNIYSARSYSYE